MNEVLNDIEKVDQEKVTVRKHHYLKKDWISRHDAHPLFQDMQSLGAICACQLKKRF
jgi:hypothetical protein